ncbi:MAG: hypothetical protein RJA72_1532, partial [Pseudomonadota bacterium]
VQSLQVADALAANQPITSAFEQAIRQALQSINPDEISPRDAQALLYELKKISDQHY